MPAKMERKKVLFFKPGAIGDFLHTLPALHAIRVHYPTAHITVMVSPGLEPLVQGTPLADSVQAFDKAKIKKSFSFFIQFGMRMQAEHYDLFVDMQPSLRSRILRLLSRPGKALVYRKQKRFRSREERLHAVDDFMRVLSPLGISEPVTGIHLPVSAAARASVERFLKLHGIEPQGLIIALNCSVGAARPARNWFPEQFASLADRLIRELHASIVFIGGGEDRDLIHKVMGMMQERAVCAAGALSLLESAALLSMCGCLVSSDTGPLHLASAVQTPVIGLYGSTDPRRTGPVGKGHRVLIKQFPCVPCEKKECPDGSRKCMAEISVDEVVSAVRQTIICV